MKTVAYQPKSSAWSLIPTEFSFLYLLLVCLFVLFPLLRPLIQFDNPLSYLGFLPLNLFITLVAATSAKEIFSMPFSFTIPRHAALVHRHLLIIGISTNLLFIMFVTPAILYPATSLSGKIQAFTSIFFAGMALYLFFSWLVLRLRDTNFLIGIATIGLIFLFLNNSARTLAFADFVSSQPLLCFFAMLLAYYPLSRVFNKPEYFRALVEQPALGFIDSLQPDRVRSFHSALALRKTGNASRYLPAWFLHWNQSLQQRGDSIFFCFYQQIALLTRTALAKATWQKCVFTFAGFIPVMVCLLLLGQQSAFPTIMAMIFLLSTISMNRMWEDSYTLPYSRSGRILAKYILGLVFNLGSIFVGLLLIFAVYLSNLINPETTWNLSLMGLLAFNCVLVPWYLITAAILMRNKSNQYMFLTTVLMVIGGVITATLLNAYLAASFPTLLALHLSGWLAYIPVLKWRYSKTDLMGANNS